MAKKSRRARRQKKSKTRSSVTPPVAATSQSAVKATKPPATPIHKDAEGPSTSRAQIDFSREYHYVINDLRNMAVIAAAMLVVLVALSFVIR